MLGGPRGRWVYLLLGAAANGWFRDSTGTTADRRGLRVRDRARVVEAPWGEGLAIRPDLDTRWAGHLVLERSGGDDVPLAIVPVTDRDAVLAWAPDGKVNW